MPSHFEIYLGNAIRVEDERLWYWRFRTSSGMILAEGLEGYVTEAKCRAAVQVFKWLVSLAPVIEAA
jgi:uncharacterized protein YegP (UPF0339 family)